MTTIEERTQISAPLGETTDVGAPGRTSSRNGFYVGLAIVLTAVVAFGVGWLVSPDSGVDVPSEVSAVVDGYETAWQNADGQAAVGFMSAGGVSFAAGGNAPGMVPWGATGSGGLTGDELASYIDSTVVSLRDGEVIGVFGDEPYVLVKSHAALGGIYESYTVYVLVEEFGDLKIATHSSYAAR